jgi:hypothetical protein
LPAAQPCHKRTSVASRAGVGVSSEDGSETGGKGRRGADEARSSDARARAERLARALRANLRRRKEQARARSAADPDPAGPDREGRDGADG